MAVEGGNNILLYKCTIVTGKHQFKHYYWIQSISE